MKKIKKIKKQAFTFAEVLLSLFILTVSIHLLSGIHFKSARRTRSSGEEIERVFYVKDKMYQLYLNPPTTDKPDKTTIEEPDLNIVAHKQEIDPKKSELKSVSKSVDIIWAEGTWERGPDSYSIKMISFVPKPKKKKSK